MRRGELSCSSEWDEGYFNFLVRGQTSENKTPDSEENLLSEWLPDGAWNAVQALATFDDFVKLPSDLLEASPRFMDWYNHAAPESEKLPLDWGQLDRTPFAKLLAVKVLRPDRMTVAVEKFVRANLPDGKEYADCDGTLNSFEILKQAYGDSSRKVPLYFILSPGADVVADVDRLAQSLHFEKGVSYHNVSMGQGQDRVAEVLLDDAAQQGHWVILNNVHLMPKWLTVLEKKLDAYNESESTHESFRLFLTSDPSDTIPIGVLARCIKLTNEPPAGLKANMKRSFCSFSSDYIENCSSQTKSILFGLCTFHSVVMERKKVWFYWI
jgi:dynein heavy chain